MYSEARGSGQSVQERLVDERAMIGRLPGYVEEQMAGPPRQVHYDVPPAPRYLGGPRSAPTIDQVLMVSMPGGHDSLVGWEGSHRNSWSMGQY